MSFDRIRNLALCGNMGSNTVRFLLVRYHVDCFGTDGRFRLQTSNQITVSVSDAWSFTLFSYGLSSV